MNSAPSVLWSAQGGDCGAVAWPLDRLTRVHSAAHPAGIVFADVREVGVGVQGHEDIAAIGTGTMGSLGISWSKGANAGSAREVGHARDDSSPRLSGYVAGWDFAMRSSSAATAGLSMRPSATPIVSV